MEEKIKEKKKKENNSSKYLFFAFVGIIMVFVVLFSIKKFLPEAKTIDDLHTANIEGKETKNNYIYNGFSFVKVGGMWYTQVQRKNKLYDISIHFGPKELEKIPIKGSIDDRFNKGFVYLTFDPTEHELSYVALATGEIGLNLAKVIGRKVIGACSQNETYACSTRPIITCNNTDNAVIYLKQKNKISNVTDNANVELKGNCMIISGSGEELIKATDRVILTWYSVMK